MAGRQTLLVVGVALALVIALLVAGSNSSSGATPKSGQIFLDAANSPGANAFTPSAAKAFAVGAATTTTVAPASTGAPTGVATVSGETIGLYGGTLNLSSCNAQQMVRYLLANPSLGQAWAAAEGIPYAGLAAYIDSLTPVILRGDTQVTNHGYVNGYATPHQSVLQAGTAVLVDNYGIPRARCYCGNPLTPPIATAVIPQYVGPQWPTFSPATVVVVIAPPAPLNTLTLVDTNTGQTFTRPVGTAGASDQPTTSASPTGSTTTTTNPITPIPPGPGTVYSLSLSNGQLSGNTGGALVTSADCDNAIQSDGLTDFQGTAFIQGSSIAFVFSNITLSGTYDSSGGQFSVTGSAPVSQGGVSGTVDFKLTGALGQTVTGGMFVETVNPPGGMCSYTMTGDRALSP